MVISWVPSRINLPLDKSHKVFYKRGTMSEHRDLDSDMRILADLFKHSKESKCVDSIITEAYHRGLRVGAAEVRGAKRDRTKEV